MTYEATFDPDTENASTAVLRALGRANGVKPIDIRPPLAESIDPDTLDIILKQSYREATQVVFTHADHRVIVEAHGRILIDDSKEDTSLPPSG